MDNAVIDLKLTVAQINVILNHLARGAYVEVQPIVDEIRAQAAPQLSLLQQPVSEQEQ
jgi:hypothetical protein